MQQDSHPASEPNQRLSEGNTSANPQALVLTSPQNLVWQIHFYEIL